MQAKLNITPEVRHSLKTALFHMTSMWDSLREIEKALEIGIEGDHIASTAADLNIPCEAFYLTDEEIDSLLTQVAALNDDEPEVSRAN